MVRKLLESNFCRVNGRVERFGSTLLKKGDIVELSPSWKSLTMPQLPPAFPTIYEGEDLLLIDKPSGWVCSEENCEKTFGRHLKLIHRLDKDTTGVLGLAKSPKAKEDWMARFANREVEKEYLAIVDGIPKEEQGTRESFLMRKRSFEGQTIWGSGSQGLHSVTHWKKLATGQNASLLLCRPITGRTHQLRVHLSELGHPILVDRQYAKTFRCTLFARRPLLHAFRFKCGSVVGCAPLPLDMQSFISSLCIEVGHLHPYLSSLSLSRN